MGASGHNTILITSNSQNHGNYRVSMLKGGAIDWLAGKGELDTSGLIRMQRYDSATGQWVDCDINDIDGFEVKLLSPEDLYNELKARGAADLATFADAYGTKDGENTLASNLSYVYNSMNNIVAQITEHNDINYSPSSDGEASIIGALYKASNYYGAVTNVLYGNLSAEADAVYGIANAIFQMDGVASMVAETSLTDGIKGLYSTNNATVNAALDKLKSTTASLYDTAKNAVMAGGRYEELSGILGTSSSAGSVGKISIGALNSAVNAIVPNLNSEVEKANGLKAGVDEFMSGIGASNILKGGVWEDVKTNMMNYHNLLDCNAKAAEFMSETVKTATMLVIEYIQDAADEISAVNKGKYGNLATINELDDTKLPELSIAITEVIININELKSTILYMENKTHTECDQCPGENGGTVSCNCHEVHDFTEEDIKPYREKLTEAEELKTELEAYKGVLEGFAPVVQQAQDIINDAISQVKGSYENPVTDTEGNQTFNSDFSLDFSKYGIDSSKDYAKLLDDYYTQLNPPTPTETTETQNPTETNPTETTPTNTTPGTNPGGSPGGSPSGGSPSTPTVPTDPKTEPTTERSTMAPTEPVERPTMAPTEPYIEHPTQSQQERPTEGQTQGDEIVTPEKPTENSVDANSSVGPTGKTKIERLSSHTGIDSPEVPQDPTIVDNPEEVVIEPVSSDYQEAIINEPPKVEPIAEQVEDSTKDNKGLKTMGIASGIGLAVGAAALGAHTMVKNKEDEESEEDYGYDK